MAKLEETIQTTWRNFEQTVGIETKYQEMADTATTTTTHHLHEFQKTLYDDDDKKIMYSLKRVIKLYELTNGYYDVDDETSSILIKSRFKGVIGVKAAVTSSSAHAVKGSERSYNLRARLKQLNEYLYKCAAESNGAGCFIREGLVTLIEVINEEEEEDCCSICLEGRKSGDVMGWIEHCDHSFHFVCLNQWMEKKHTCPVCRLEMDQLLTNRGDHHVKRTLRFG